MPSTVIKTSLPDALAFAALEVGYPQVAEMHCIRPCTLGDIVISVDTAQRQAQQQEHTLRIELTYWRLTVCC